MSGPPPLLMTLEGTRWIRVRANCSLCLAGKEPHGWPGYFGPAHYFWMGAVDLCPDWMPEVRS